MVERDPITTAKEVASLDRLSGGRFLFGVGAGWNVEEMANHGTGAAKRFGIMRERIEAMKAIWTQDEPSYHGRYVDFDPIWSWPKPVSEPHPPILVGGNGERVLERVIAFGDEWMPNRIPSAEALEARIAKLRELAQEAGRPMPRVGYFGVPAKPDVIEGYERAGVTRCVLSVPPVAREEAEGRLDELVRVIEEYRGAG